MFDDNLVIYNEKTSHRLRTIINLNTIRVFFEVLFNYKYLNTIIQFFGTIFMVFK